MSALRLPPRLRDYGLVALLLASLADKLAFDMLGRPMGLSVPLFAAAVALGAAFTHRHLLSRQLVPYALLLIAGLLALMENVSARSLCLTLLCLAGFALAAGRRLPAGLSALPVMQRFLATAPLALFRADRQRRRAVRRARQRGLASALLDRSWLVWIMPLVLAIGFTLLLSAGNPILERWLALVDPFLLLEALDPLRILFWIAVVVFVWPFLRPRLRTLAGRPMVSGPAKVRVSAHGFTVWSPLICGPAAILRALLLFNAVFAAQTLLDAVYLWGGLELPEGISYAAYAHRGAYTLIATALLAAVFVLLALRPGAAAAADRRIRALVYLWIGQNVVLVLSSMLRLDLYVDVYALTHWRLAAFVWMAIVAAGLVLICVRIAWQRTNRWLIGANLVVLALVVIISCFVDDNAFIARFNVDHSSEITGDGVSLDVGHLASLGPAAIPAIDIFLRRVAPDEERPWVDVTIQRLQRLRPILAMHHQQDRSPDWRGWSFRNWRLSRYLEANSMPVPPVLSGPALPSFQGPT